MENNSSDVKMFIISYNYIKKKSKVTVIVERLRTVSDRARIYFCRRFVRLAIGRSRNVSRLIAYFQIKG